MDGESDRVWYVARGEHTYGPFSDDGFAQFASSGQLSLNDYVWFTGLSQWVLCAQLCPEKAQLSVEANDAPVFTAPDIAQRSRPFLPPIAAQSTRLISELRAFAALAKAHAVPLATAMRTRFAQGAAGFVFSILVPALRGIAGLMMRCAAFVRERVAHRLPDLRRSTSFYFLVFALVPFVSITAASLIFFGRAFLSKTIEARINSALEKKIPGWMSAPGFIVTYTEGNYLVDIAFIASLTAEQRRVALTTLPNAWRSLYCDDATEFRWARAMGAPLVLVIRDPERRVLKRQSFEAASCLATRG